MIVPISSICKVYLPTFQLFFMVNVGKYTIHGLFGIYIYQVKPPFSSTQLDGCNVWDNSTYPKVRRPIIVGCFVFVGGVGTCKHLKMPNVPGPNA